MECYKNKLSVDEEIFYKRLEYEHEVSNVKLNFERAKLDLEHARDFQLDLLHNTYQQQRVLIRTNVQDIPVFVRTVKPVFVLKQSVGAALTQADAKQNNSTQQAAELSSLGDYKIEKIQRYNKILSTVVECGTQTEFTEIKIENEILDITEIAETNFLENLKAVKISPQNSISDNITLETSLDDIDSEDSTLDDSSEIWNKSIDKYNDSENEDVVATQSQNGSTKSENKESENNKSDSSNPLSSKLRNVLPKSTRPEISDPESSKTESSSSENSHFNSESSESESGHNENHNITSSPIKSRHNSNDSYRISETTIKSDMKSDVKTQKDFNSMEDFDSLNTSSTDSESEDCFDTDSDDQRNMIKLKDEEQSDVSCLQDAPLNCIDIDKRITELAFKDEIDYTTKCHGWNFNEFIENNATATQDLNIGEFDDKLNFIDSQGSSESNQTYNEKSSVKSSLTSSVKSSSKSSSKLSTKSSVNSKTSNSSISSLKIVKNFLAHNFDTIEEHIMTDKLMDRNTDTTCDAVDTNLETADESVLTTHASVKSLPYSFIPGLQSNTPENDIVTVYASTKSYEREKMSGESKSLNEETTMDVVTVNAEDAKSLESQKSLKYEKPFNKNWSDSNETSDSSVGLNSSSKSTFESKSSDSITPNYSLLTDYRLFETIQTSEVYFPSSAIQLLDGNILVCSAGTKTLCIFNLLEPNKVISRYPPKWQIDSSNTFTLPDTVTYDNLSFIEAGKEFLEGSDTHPKIFVRDQDKIVVFEYNSVKKELCNALVCEDYTSGDIEDCRDLKICRTHPCGEVCVTTYDKVLKNLVFYDQTTLKIVEEVDLSSVLVGSEVKIEYFEFLNGKHEIFMSDYKSNKGCVHHLDLSDSNNPQILHKLGKLDVPIGKGLAGITIDKYNNFLLTVKRPYDNRPHQSITVFREDCWVRCDNLILENLMNPEIEFYDGKNFYFDKMFSKMKPINVWFNQMNGKLFVCDVNKHRSRVLIFQGVSVRKEKYKKKQNLGGK